MTAARHYEHPGAEEIELTRVLFALSDPLRLAMVRHLAAVAAEVDSLELGPDLPRSTLTHHTRLLRESGVTLTRASGRKCLIRLRTEDLQARFPGLLDAVLAALPEESAAAGPSPAGGPRRIAILGRPNVGKSSLLNRLAQAERVVVDPLAGTTRDPVDETVELDGRPWTFVDTAGVRRRVRQAKGADFYASLRTQAALEKAELGLVLLDASEPLTEQDVRVMQQVIDAGRALVLVCNKWDLVSGDRRAELDREMERELVQIRWAERVNLSAKTGWHANRLTRAMQTALDSWDRRIPTGRLNSFLGELAAAHPHPVRGGRQPRILFATQPSVRPPRFVLFASGFLEAGYRRFIENRLRERFGFPGTPIQISVRVRERRKRR